MDAVVGLLQGICNVKDIEKNKYIPSGGDEVYGEET